MADPRPLTRYELKKFLPDERAIRAFEQLFSLIPSELLSLLSQVAAASTDANTALSTAQLSAYRRSIDIDYIDFNGTPPHSDKPRRVVWSNDDDTLNVHHTGGVTLQVGLEEYSRITNNMAYSFPNGSVIGLGVALASDVDLYIADGTFPLLYVIGIATQDIAPGETGRLTVRGQIHDLDTTGTPYGETWAVGDILYVSPTVAGGLTNAKPTAPDNCIPIALVLDVDATQGIITVRPTIEQNFRYGAFYKTADANPAAINTAYPITLDTTAESNGVHIDGTVTSRIVAEESGLYSFHISWQLTSGSASAKTVYLWFRKNGVDIDNTTMRVSLDSNTEVKEPSRSLFFSLLKDEYIELMWAADSTNVTLDASAATAFAPSAPSVVVTVEQIQQ